MIPYTYWLIWNTNNLYLFHGNHLHSFPQLPSSVLHRISSQKPMECKYSQNRTVLLRRHNIPNLPFSSRCTQFIPQQPKLILHGISKSKQNQSLSRNWRLKGWSATSCHLSISNKIKNLLCCTQLSLHPSFTLPMFCRPQDVSNSILAKFHLRPTKNVTVILNVLPRTIRDFPHHSYYSSFNGN